jgi:superfamily I DNA/RNA helicase
MSPEPVVRMRRSRLASASGLTLDAAQSRAVRHRGSPLRLLGGPGSGKTTTLVEAVAARVEQDGLDAGQVLVLGPTRAGAARLRELVTARLVRTVRQPLARTAQSFAFGVLRIAAARAGDPAPRLITGPEQDLVLRELLAGHRAGEGSDPGWPADLSAALGTRGLRAELRDLLMRAVERGIGPDDLADLGRLHHRPEWVAAASVLREYLDVTGLGTPGGYDPASVVGDAVAALAADPGLLATVHGQITFVAMDDAQEATPGVADLIRAVTGGRPDVLLAGDPDAMTQAFRGARRSPPGSGRRPRGWPPGRRPSPRR